MSTSTTTNLSLIKDGADEPIVNLRTHLNSNLDSIDINLCNALDKILDLTNSPVNTLAGLSSAPSIAVNLASNSAANVLQASPRPGVTGTLGISNGGTGLTSSPSMLTNLGSTSADNVLKASPRPGITGTLPVAHGGTGLTASPSILINLESGSADNVLKATPRPGVVGKLPTECGGTGQGGVRLYDTVSDIITAATGCSITQALAYKWGYVLEIYLQIKCNSAKSSGDVIATLKPGFRPVTTTPLLNAGAVTQGAAAYTNGEVQAKGSFGAGNSLFVTSTYLLVSLPTI